MVNIYMYFAHKGDRTVVILRCAASFSFWILDITKHLETGVVVR